MYNTLPLCMIWLHIFIFTYSHSSQTYRAINHSKRQFFSLVPMLMDSVLLIVCITEGHDMQGRTVICRTGQASYDCVMFCTFPSLQN